MANNKIRIKRTSVTGRTPNTTNSGNSQYIDAGELALNLTDQKLFSSNGSAYFEVGSNVSTLTVNTISANGSVGSAGQVLKSNGSVAYWDTVASGGVTVRSTAGDGGTVGTTVSSVTGINFDSLTGFNVTDQGSGNVFVSLGSSFKTIEVAGQTSITAVGEDTLVIANGSNIVLTTSNVAPKTLTIALSSNVVTNTQLSSNLANYQTTAGLSSNVATLTANNATYAFGKSESNLNVNSALTSNNSSYLGGTAASGYQTTAGLSANVATLTANNTSFVGSVSAANVVSNAQLQSNLANYQTTAGLASNVATLTANNTSYVGTVTAANVVSNAQLQANLANYQTEAGLSANVATLTANSAHYLYDANNIGNSQGIFVGTDLTAGLLQLKPSQIRIVNTAVDTVVNTAGVFTSGRVNAASLTVGSTVVINTTALDINSPTLRITWPGGSTYGPPQFSTYSDGARIVLYDDISGTQAGYAIGIDSSTLWYGTDRTVSSHKWYSGTTLHMTSNTSGLFVTDQVNATAFNVGSSFTANSTRVAYGTTVGLEANGTIGTAGQYLTSNGTTIYWSTPGAVSINTAAQYTWTNTQTFSNTITFSQTINGTANNSLYLGGTVASGYQTTAGLSSNVATLTANNTSFVGSVSAANVVSNAQLSSNLANYQTTAGLSANVATLTANNTSYLGGVAAASYVNTSGSYTITGVHTYNANIVIGTSTGISANGGYGTSGQVLTSNGTTVYWSTPSGGGGSVNVDAQYTWTNTQTFSNTITFSQTINGTANNSLYLGGTAAADYQTTAGLSSNVATLTANNTSFVGTVSAANVVSNAQLQSNLTNYQTTAGLASNVATLTANNANNLGGVVAAAYVNTSGSYTITGVHTYNANIVVGTTAGISANGGYGTAGQVLTSNGTTVYWSAVTGGGSVNVDSQYTWTNTQTFSNTITFSQTINGTANNALYLGGVAAASYVNTSGSYTITGVHTHNANLVIGTSAGLSANGGYGTSGQVLTSNGTTTYWAVPSITARVSSTASITSPLSWNSDNYDLYAATAQAGALTFNADAGTPTDGRRIMFRIKDNGTARALTFTTGSTNSFRAVGVSLPTTTVVSKILYVGCIYNAADSRWDVIATGQEA
jgi:hypothetical protein